MAQHSSLIPLTSSARNALVFANTPSLLYRLLQSDAMVQYAVESMSEDELLDVIGEWSFERIDVPEMLLQPYVALIAMSLIASPEMWARAKVIAPALPWMRELADLADSVRNDVVVETSANLSQDRSEVVVGSGDWSEMEGVSFVEVR